MLCKGKIKIIFIFSAIFIFLYIFIVSIPIKQEINFIPIWSVDVNLKQENIADNAPKGKDEQYKQRNFLGKESFLFTFNNFKTDANNDSQIYIPKGIFGYFAADGTILSTETFSEKLTASSSMWATYSTKSEKIQVYSPEGVPLFIINRAGYLHITEDRIYLFEPGGNTVCKYDTSGNMLWRFAHTAVITAFNSSTAGTIIGYSDGKLIYLDNKGNANFSFYPGGSNYQVINGVAISTDGTKAVCICGKEQQRILLISITGTNYKIVHHEYFSRDLHRRIFASFDKTGNFAVFESADGIGIIDCKKLKIFFIEEYGKIINLGSTLKNNFLTILLQQENICTLVAIQLPTFLVGKTKFKTKNSFLIQDEDRLYLGIDSKISALEIRGLK